MQNIWGKAARKDEFKVCRANETYIHLFFHLLITLNISDVGVQPARQSIIGTNYGSTILFRNEGETDIIAWDTNTCYAKTNFRTVYKGEACILATHAIPDYKRQKMIVLESNFIDYLKNTVGCGAIQQLSIVEGCYWMSPKTLS